MELNFNRIPLLCIKFIYSGLLVKCGSATATLCSHRSQPAATSCRNCRHCAAASSCRHCCILQPTHAEIAATLCRHCTASISYSKCSHIMHSCRHCNTYIHLLLGVQSSYVNIALQPPYTRTTAATSCWEYNYIAYAAHCRERYFILPHWIANYATHHCWFQTSWNGDFHNF